jgi:hypothetical protein
VDGNAGLVAVRGIEAPGGFEMRAGPAFLAAAMCKDHAFRFEHFLEQAAVGIVAAVGDRA